MRSARSRRRTLLRGLGLASVGLALGAGCLVSPSSQPRPRRVGVLDSNIGSQDEVFRRRLADLGYVEGTDLTIEWRSGNNDPDRLPRLAAELVSLPVDVLVALATPAARAAKAATTSIPVVFLLVNDPVGQGLVTGLARPGGNVTGFSTLSGAISGKRVELLKAVAPSLSRLAVFWNSTNTGMALALQETQAAATAVGLTVQALGLADPPEAEAALQAALAQGAEGIIALPALDPQITDAIADFALRHRLPTIYSDASPPRRNGLMGFGPDYDELRRGAADYVDKILRGSKPGDLPVVQASKFDFAINVRTAQVLRLTIPPDVAAQVTEWVQ